MSRDTSFYYSFLVLPPRKRRAIVAVWDFCRAVDDAVDEVVPDELWRRGLTPEARALAAGRLAVWRRELAACYEGTPETTQGVALVPFIKEFHLPRKPFDELVDGVEMDLDHVRYPTWETLVSYCRRVASTVGLICIEIFGYRDARTQDYAVNLGLALQLTNIIRDVATDARRGRIYLPTEDLVRFGCTEEMVSGGRLTPELRALLAFECERAHVLYRQARASLPARDVRRMVAAEIMGGIYFGILQRIERAGYDVFSGRIRVPRPARAVIAARIWLRSLLGV